MHQAFRKASDPVIYLGKKRDDYFKTFQTFCQGATTVAIFADFLASKLQTAIHQAVYTKVCLDIADLMQNNCQALNGNREKLEFHILKELAAKQNFQAFQMYINFPKQYFEEFITNSVYSYCKENDNLKTFLNTRLRGFQCLLLKAIATATSKTKDIGGSVVMWLDEFCSQLGGELQLGRQELKAVEHQEIKDIGFLTESVTKALENVVESLSKDFQKTSLKDIEHGMSNIIDILIEQLCGCWEKCPFCNAVCTNTIPGHDGDHSVPFHRPQAVTGTTWYKTNYLVTDICTSLVASDCSIVLSESNKIPYKRYRDAGIPYSQWSITADNSSLKYWQWYVAYFRENLESSYKSKFEGRGNIPDTWTKIKKEEALSEIGKRLTSNS
ncbi:interferon-induced very large GTPase 1 [Amia ocellicauda]|uniref:interferon-induced very large GTPase 1 n=1 Tax=Amia ocellicauda TaxID=2972642 RepID=UPI00346471C8